MGKTCVICGKPSGMYPLCREHLQMKNEGFIVKCEDCGQWHFVDSLCSCQKSATYTELPTEGFETCVSCGAKTNGYAFCRKCFKKYSNDEMLEILNGAKLDDSFDDEEEEDEVSIYSEEYEPSNEDELTCIICGKPSNGKHFCRSCYYKYKDKILYLQIKKCAEFVKLEAEYQSELKCDDGHMVKSPYEKIIDNWLYSEGIKHAYEREIDINENRNITPDFFIPEYKGTKNIYVEFWGYGQENIKYQKSKEYKMALYPELVKRDNIAVVYLNKKEVDNDSYKTKIKYAKQGEIKE